MNKLFILLIIYQLKHFICDYPLQGKYMLGKFKPFPDCIIPLLAHSWVHGIATYLICLVFNPHLAFTLAMIDTGAHFIIDRIKASPVLLGRFKSLSANEMKYISSNGPENFKDELKSNTYFWWCLGADQLFHHLTHYLLVYLLYNSI